ncbi:MAG: ImuA family protein [Rhizobiaceae bacterium]
MATNPTIAALRDHIGQQEHTGHNWPSVSLGVLGGDRLLPQGELKTGSLYEIVPETYADFPAALGFGFGVLSRISRERSGYILWVQPNYRTFGESRLFPPGLSSFGIDPNRIIHVNVPKPQNVLWALDEALANTSVVAAIGMIPEDDRTYDFTASRRLSMRAARHGATALIFPRGPDFAMTSAAEMRWSVAAGSSVTAHYKGQSMPGMGGPRWQIRIAKSRRGNAGHWCVEWNHEKLSFRLAAPLADRAPLRIAGIETGQLATA